jgi:hypothetical protein
MFVLIKGMGHERHMVFLVGTSSQNGQFFKMVHQGALGLVKSAILNGNV